MADKNKNLIKQKTLQDKNIEIFKKHFPQVLDCDPEDGKYTINAEELQMLIEPAKAKLQEDGYELNWVGKRQAYHTAFSRNYKLLKPCRSESKDWDNTKNIFIKGDNLDALKILRNAYNEKIKMIYIDPPYNTKSDEFIYKDKFTKSEEEVLDELGYNDEQVDYIKDIYGSKTHSGWLSFMFPRLLLAKDLLTDDGVIFISIDDNEQAQLKILCDRVFGAANFVATIIWQKKFSPQNDATYFSNMHDFILCYANRKKNNKDDKGWQRILLPRTSKNDKKFSNPDNDPRGDWSSGDFTAEGIAKNCIYEIESPAGEKFLPPEGKRWGYNYDNYIKLRKENRFWFGKEGKSFPRIKRYKNEVQKGLVPNTIWFHNEVGHTQEAKQETNRLMGSPVYDYPKPSRLIKRLLQISTNKNDLVLDFFAGTGTTADAVMQLNAEDGGNRKFIMVQLTEEINPQKTSTAKVAYDFCNNNKLNPGIDQISIEKIRRAGEKIKTENPITTRNLDIGFRVFKITEDNSNEIFKKPITQITQGELKNYENKQSIDTLLYNLMLQDFIALDEKINKLEDKIYKAGDNIYLFKEISDKKMENLFETIENIDKITIYAPFINSDKFTLEISGLVDQFNNNYRQNAKLQLRG